MRRSALAGLGEYRESRNCFEKRNYFERKMYTNTLTMGKPRLPPLLLVVNRAGIEFAGAHGNVGQFRQRFAIRRKRIAHRQRSL